MLISRSFAWLGLCSSGYLYFTVVKIEQAREKKAPARWIRLPSVFLNPVALWGNHMLTRVNIDSTLPPFRRPEKSSKRRIFFLTFFSFFPASGPETAAKSSTRLTMHTSLSFCRAAGDLKALAIWGETICKIGFKRAEERQRRLHWLSWPKATQAQRPFCRARSNTPELPEYADLNQRAKTVFNCV